METGALDKIEAENARGAKAAEPFARWAQRCAALAQRVAALDPVLAARLDARCAMLVSPEIKIAFVGRFNAGKSTLINALIGRAALPTDDLPETGAPTFIRAGLRDRARYIAKGVEADIAASPEAIRAYTSLITEDGARRAPPGDARIALDLAIAPMGADAIWIDTPGRDEDDGATAMSNAALAEADHVVWVSSSRQPLGEGEMAEIARWIEERGAGALTLVINAFLRSDEEAAWRAFLERTPAFLSKRIESLGKVARCFVAGRAAERRLRGEDGWGVPTLSKRLRTLERSDDLDVRTSRVRVALAQDLRPLLSEVEARRSSLLLARARRDAFEHDLASAVQRRLVAARADFTRRSQAADLQAQNPDAPLHAIETAIGESVRTFCASFAGDVEAIAERHGCTAPMADVAAWLGARLTLPPATKNVQAERPLALGAAFIGAVLGAAVSPGLALIGAGLGFGGALYVMHQSAKKQMPAWRRRAMSFDAALEASQAALPREILNQCGALHWPYPSQEALRSWECFCVDIAAAIDFAPVSEAQS